MAKLFKPFTLRGITIPNRVMVSPMCMYSAKDGVANDFHFVHLGKFALGGAGLVMVSAVDYVDGGVSIEDTVEFAKRLKEIGIDVVDCSSGGISPHGIPPRAYGFQVPFADQVRRDAEIPTAAVGLITRPEQAEQILANEQADLIALAREVLADPNWALHARTVLDEKGSDRFERWPTQYQVWLSKRARVLKMLDAPASDGQLVGAL